MKELNIEYQSYIPDNLITDFAQLAHPTKIEKNVVKTSRWNNFETTPINDIIIYISQHQTEFLVSIMTNAVWAGIVLLWVGISKLSRKLFPHGRQLDDKKTSILIHISDSTRGIDIVFEGDVTKEQADTLIDSVKQFLNSGKVDDFFNNSDYIEEKFNKPVITLKYNQEIGIWEPENFGEKRRRSEELRKQFERKWRS